MNLDARVTVLDNGIAVATSRIPEVQSAAVGLWAAVGGRHEAARLCGASHFLEHMLFKGTPTRTARRISRDVEGRGGYLNAFTQAESTCLYGRVAADHMARVFRILADMYAHARLSARDVENEKAVVMEELLMGRDQPDHHVQDLLDEQLWPGHPLGRNLSGTERTVQALKPDILAAFKERHYVGRNTVATFAGAVEHEACVALTRSVLGHLPAGRPTRFRPAGPVAVKSPVRMERRRIEQAHVAMGFRVFGRHDERRWALSLLSVVLGGNMSSRLFHQIRERRGWAYSIQSTVQFFADTGVLSISAGLDADAAGRAVAEIVRQLLRLRESPVPPAELRTARDYAVGQLRIALEGSTSRMMWLGENRLGYGRIHQPGEAIHQLESVTADDIRCVAQTFLRRPGLALSALAPDAPDAGRLETEMERQWERLV